MSTRIGTLGAQDLYLSRLLDIQSRMQNEQSQVTTGLKSTTYSGIASQANSAINLENEKTLANQFLSDNAITNTKLDAESTSLTSVQTSITNLLNQLNLYAQGNTSDPQQVQALQTAAMNSMVDLQSYLGVNIDGQYLFSGGRVSTPPVSLPATTLAQFQAMYNGSTTTFPTTRAGDLADLDLTSTQTGDLTFDTSNGLIIPADAGGYSTVPAGAYVQIAGTSSNNGNFTITGQPAMSSAGTMLSETGNIGSNAAITYDNGTATLSNATTGNLSFSFNSAGQIVMTPAKPNTLQGLASVGSTFTISGSDSTITSATTADATTLIGTNLYGYTSGATSPTGITIADTDQLVVTDKTSGLTYTFQPGPASTLGDLVSWVGTATGGDVTAAVNNQGQITLTNNSATDSYSIGGTLDGLLGFNSSAAIADNGGTVTSGAIYDHANAQPLASLQNGSGSPLMALGDTLTLQTPSNGAGATFTVGASSTLTDLTSWIQQQDPNATVSFANGKLSITNGSAGNYIFGGNVATELGLGTINNGNTGIAALPVVPGSCDGAYQVVAYNSDGSVVLANDTAPATTETMDATKLGLMNGTPPGGTAFATGAAAGDDATFTVSGDTVTMTLPSTTNSLTAGPAFNPGDPITISGTADHNGTYTVSSVTAHTVSFQINPAALRVSQLVQQTGRSDETMTFDTTQANTSTDTSVVNPVPGTVYNGVATLDSSVFGSLDFSPDGGPGGEKISSNIPGAFVDTTGAPYPPVGTVITLKSTSGVNDGVYTVTDNDGTNLTIQSNTVTAESGASTSTASMTAASWYKGDTLSIQQGIDTDRQIDTGIFASDPAFEKAIRAMGILAEGAYGTAGGLENHPERIAAAQYLLNDALQHTEGGTPPYGPEETSDVTSLVESVGYTQSVIKTVNDKHDSYVGFIETRVADIETADQTTAITELQADSTALQASYQILARVSNLSLLDYLPAPTG